MHVIDIPHDCPIQIISKILEKSNMVILHSWLSENETTKEMKKLKKQYSIPIIGLIRDCKDHNSLKSLQNNSIARELPQKIINLSNK
jgi:Tat protein secretion system quality control protein TatD with DNase activity